MKKSLIALSCFLLMPPGMFYGANCLIINKGTCAVNCSVSATISTVSQTYLTKQRTGRHQPPWRNVSKIFFENRSSGGVVELGRHQPLHRSVSEISEEIEATEVPAVA